MDHRTNEHPLNPLPPVVWLLAGPIILGEILFGIGHAGVAGDAALGWRLDALQRFAFDPGILRQMVAQNLWPWRQVARIVTYPFVHGSLTHAAMVLVFVLALGKMVGEVFRWWAVLVVFAGSSILGALAYGFLVPGLRAPLIGAYPAVYGLIGAFTFLLWVNLARTGANRYRAFSLIGMLLFFQLLFGVLFGGNWDWVADIAGFGSGFLLSFVVSPGGWARVMDKMRQR